MIGKVQQQTNSTLENTENLKLSIQFSLDGFSFSISENRSKKIIYFSEYPFDKKATTPEILLTKIKEIFKKDTHLQYDFSSVFVIHQNDLSTLVPEKYFDENILKDYLGYTVKTLASDFIAFDDVEILQAKNVYIPYVNINNYLFQNFGEFEYTHHLTILLEKLIAQNNSEDTKMYVYVSKNSFDIVVLKGKNLLLSNTFSFSSKEDFVYYILFTAEQLNLDRNTFQLFFLGIIQRESKTFKLVYKYIRNIDFLESENPIFNTLEQPKHSNYILLG